MITIWCLDINWMKFRMDNSILFWYCVHFVFTIVVLRSAHNILFHLSPFIHIHWQPPPRDDDDGKGNDKQRWLFGWIYDSVRSNANKSNASKCNNQPFTNTARIPTVEIGWLRWIQLNGKGAQWRTCSFHFEITATLLALMVEHKKLPLLSDNEFSFRDAETNQPR